MTFGRRSSGEDSNEQAGVTACRGAGASEERGTAIAGGCGVDEHELSQREAAAEAVRCGRSSGAETRQRGAAFKPGAASERASIVKLVREKYSGDTKTRFGPTLAAEHLA